MHWSRSLRDRRTRSLAVALFLAGAAGLPSHPSTAVARTMYPARTAPAASGVLVPTAGNGLLLAPRQSSTLAVQVADSRGAPRPDQLVTFVAPAGAGGSFAGKLFTRQRSDRRGLATARFTAGMGRGAYLVDAVLMDGGAATTFAVTVAPASPAPALRSDSVRRAAQSLLHLTAQQAATRLYGPVLLEPGTVLGTPVSSALGRRGAPTRLTRRSWFLWADDRPGTDFAHATRFVLADATGIGTHWIPPSAQSWWPVLRLPGARKALDLRPASATTAVLGFATQSFAAAMAHADASDTCAIVVSGDTDWSHISDTIHMGDALQGLGFSVYRTPGNRAATERDLSDLVHAVEANPKCKKVWLYLAAHGYHAVPGGSGAGIVMQNAPNNWFNHYAGLDYWQIADMLRPLAARGVQFTVVVDACYSGSAVPVFDNFGIPGVVLTSADAIHTSYFRYWFQPLSGGLFTNALLAALADPNAHVLHDGVVDHAALDRWIRDHYIKDYVRGYLFGTNLLGPKPQHVTIDLHPVQPYHLPPVPIADAGNGGSLVVKRPPNIPIDAFVSITLSISNTDVAAFKNGSPTIQVSLDPGEQSVTVPLTTQGDGSTTVAIDGYDINTPGRPFHGESTIEVGSGIRAPDITLHVGESTRATVHLTGAMAQYLAQGRYPVASIYLEGYDGHIAAVRGFAESGATIHLEKPNTAGRLVITGISPGRTVVHASAVMPRFPLDPLWVRDVTFTITVLPAASITGTTGITGTVEVTATVSPTPGGVVETRHELVATPSSLEFQAVVGGEPDSKGFSLSNAGTSTVTITSILIPHGYSLSPMSSCRPGSAPIAPGMLCIGHIWFTPPAVGDYPGTLEVTYVREDGSEGLVTIALDGHAQGVVPTDTPPSTTGNQPTSTPTSTPSAVPPSPSATATPTASPVPRVSGVVNPGAIQFGYVQVGTAGSPQRVTLTNTGNAPLNVSNLRVVGAQSGDFALGSSDCGTLQPGQSCSVAVTFTPGGPGLRSGSLQFTDNAPDSPQMVSLSGVGTEPGSVNGNHINIGTLVQGQNETVTVTVTNVGQVPATVGDFAVTGSNLTVTANSCTGVVLAPGGSCTMTLRVTGAVLGPFSDSIAIGTTPAGGLQPIDVSGYVIPQLP